MIVRPTPFNLDEFLDKNPQINFTRLSKKSPSPPSQPNRTRDALSQARAWILKCPPAVAGQGGHPKTFGVCCSLLKGFCLTLPEAKSLLDIWNSTCVPCWSHADLESKLLAAQKSADLQPQGWMISKKEHPFGNIIDQVFDNEPESKQTDEETKYNHSGILDDPAALAIKFMEANKTDIGLCAYRWWNGQFYKWNNIHYDPLSKDRINSDLSQYMEEQFLKQYLIECAAVPAGDDISKIKKKKLNGNLIENIKTFLINILIIPDANKSEPFFLGQLPDAWKPDEIIPVKDKLVHLPSFVDNIGTTHIPKSPKYFSTYSLNYKFPYDYYEGPVDPPPIWEETLRGIWPNDEESILCLQEFYGYFLTPCTRLEKILMLIGQKRSGKGTIIRTLKHMLGRENVCFPTFKSLTTQFGKQSLIGKSLAVFPDARITGRTDTGDVVETLLSISGEDDQTIDRKYLAAATTHLTTRFVIASNELPRLTENSGALVSRAIVLAFNETFLDQEDIDLEQKLMPEIPRILRWSIDGFKRLYRRKRLFQPRSGAQMVDDFLHLSSPISHYISDSVDVGPEHTSDTRSLYLSWRNWCEWNGRENPGDMDNFIRNLRSAVPKLDFSGEAISHNGDGGSRRWAKPIRGLRIKPEPEPAFVLVTSDGINESHGETNGHANGNDVRIPF